MRIFITGIEGTIGSILAEKLAPDHEVSGIDFVPSEKPRVARGDLRELAEIAPLFRDIDTVIHLAAERRHDVEIGWDQLMGPNVAATANVFEAAHSAGVRRLVLASSMHVMGVYEEDEPYRSIVLGDYEGLDPRTPLVTAEMPVRPDSRYGASKVFGEALGRYYAEVQEMEVISVRLGAISDDDRPGSDSRSWVAWLSKRDVAALFAACVERTGIRHEILYGASANHWKVYDTPRAWQVLGYTPSDNAEEFRGGA